MPRNNNPAVDGARSREAEEVTEYSQNMCFNCGDPGQLQAKCLKPKLCFICKSTAHAVSDCPVRKRPHQLAKFVGSDATGLGFYHIEVPDMGQNAIGSYKNCGVVYIESEKQRRVS